jgi:hypothetical protein
MFESFLFKKIELWVLLLALLIGILVAVLFGWVINRANHNPAIPGPISQFALGVATMPDKGRVLGDMIAGRSYSHILAIQQRFPGQNGFEFNYAPGTRPDLGYVLINRYSGESGRSEAALVDLNSQKVVHRWIDAEAEPSDIAGPVSTTVLPGEAGGIEHFGHPLLLDDGSLVVQEDSPLARFDHCGRLLFVQAVDEFHHSIELGPEGNIWAPVRIRPKTVDIGREGQFSDDGIVAVSLDGEVISSKSVIRILAENGLGIYVYGMGRDDRDPIHLNDIQPVFEDGILWRKGDLFLSSRHRSMVLLYRPSTNEVLWHRIGPWMHQHDVDVLDERRIAVYDNNARLKHASGEAVVTTNDWVVVDVVSGEMTRPFHDAFSSLNIRTPTQGLAELVNDNELLVEEADYGRIIQFDRSGNITWQYVNRAPNGSFYQLSWSRLVPRELGDAVRGKVAEEPCNS